MFLKSFTKICSRCSVRSCTTFQRSNNGLILSSQVPTSVKKRYNSTVPIDDDMFGFTDDQKQVRQCIACHDVLH